MSLPVLRECVDATCAGGLSKYEQMFTSAPGPLPAAVRAKLRFWTHLPPHFAQNGQKAFKCSPHEKAEKAAPLQLQQTFGKPFVAFQMTRFLNLEICNCGCVAPAWVWHVPIVSFNIVVSPGTLVSFNK